MAGTMDRVLDRALKIRVGEGPKVAFMAFYAANAIGAVVVGRTVRDTLFLADRTRDDLPMMYIINSIAVAVLSWGYARIADGMRRDRLNSAVAAAWGVIMVAFYGAATVSAKATAPVLYVAVEAMGALVVIQFWTFAQDVFTSREAKRLFPLISAGGQAANVVYGFLASSLSKRVSAESLLLLCAINLLACSVLAMYIARRFGTTIGTDRPRGRQSERSRTAHEPRGFRAIATPHLITIALIGVASAVAVNLVDYEFKSAAEIKYSVDKKAMGAYFGRFYGVCGALALALQMGLTGRILERFGILASLLPLPIGLMTGTMFAWLFPSGWTTSLAKGSDSIFRYTLNDASMQLLYVPVPPHQRGRAKAMIDGILKPLAGVAAGLLLVALGHGPKHFQRAQPITERKVEPEHQAEEHKVPVEEHKAAAELGKEHVIAAPIKALEKTFKAVEEEHKAITAGAVASGHVEPPDAVTTTVIILLGCCWVGLLYRGKREYITSLLDTLQKRRLDLGAAPMNADQSTGDAIAKILRSNDALAILNALELLPHVQGRDFGPLVAELLDHRISSIRAAAADHLAAQADVRYADKLRERLSDRDPWCVASAIGAICVIERERAAPLVKPFLVDPRPAIRAAAVVGLVRHGGINGILVAAEELKRQLNAASSVERELAASLLGALGVPTFYDALLRFLDDPSPNVRRAALKAAGRLKSPELVRPLLTLLGRRDTTRDAAQALAAFGPGIEPALGAALRDEKLPIEIRRCIPPVLGKVSSREAADILLGSLEMTDPPLRAITAKALARLVRRRSDIVIQREVVVKGVAFEISHAENLFDVQAALNLPTVDRNAAFQMPGTKGSGVLLSLALAEERDRSIQRAIVLLELLHPDAGLDLVADNLRSDSPARRANAVEVLDNTVQDRLIRPTPTTRPAKAWLTELITGPHAWISACAAQYALEHQIIGVDEALRAGLESSTPYVREACATALARLSPGDARSFLLKLKDDPARSVRRLIEELFGRPLAATA